MSVLVLPKINYVFAKDMLNRSRFNNVCEFGWCSVIHSMYAHREKEFVQVVNDWQMLNHLSYYARYQDETLSVIRMPKPVLYTDKPGHIKQPDFYQLLQVLECLKYNIDFEEIEDAANEQRDNVAVEIWQQFDKDRYLDAIVVLQRCIHDLKDGALRLIPQYNSAAYYLQ